MKVAAMPAAIASRLRFQLVVAGWPGAVGLALLVAACVVQFVLLPQQWQATESARADAAELQRQAALAPAGGGARSDAGSAESLARFRDSLTREANADEALETIQRAAGSHGLVLAGTEYKWQRQPAAKLAEIQISLPVKGGYGPLRGFLQDVMADVPGLALDQFDLQRESVAGAVAEARLRFTLYLRTGA
jgi:Tfp pilus assembly protein PilO